VRALAPRPSDGHRGLRAAEELRGGGLSSAPSRCCKGGKEHSPRERCSPPKARLRDRSVEMPGLDEVQARRLRAARRLLSPGLSERLASGRRDAWWSSIPGVWSEAQRTLANHAKRKRRGDPRVWRRGRHAGHSERLTPSRGSRSWAAAGTTATGRPRAASVPCRARWGLSPRKRGSTAETCSATASPRRRNPGYRTQPPDRLLGAAWPTGGGSSWSSCQSVTRRKPRARRRRMIRGRAATVWLRGPPPS
jgi:hypothetical protein